MTVWNAGLYFRRVVWVIEDDKVFLEDLQAKIEEDEEHIQSTSIAAMQKLRVMMFLDDRYNDYGKSGH